MGVYKKHLKIVLVGLIAIAAFFSGKFVLLKRTDNVNSLVNSEKKIYVETILSQSIEIVPKLSYKATIEPTETGTVCSKMSGKVTQVLFDNGTYVEKGTTLVILDDQELQNQLKAAQNQLKIAYNQLNSAKPNLQKIETNMNIAQREYERLKERYENVEISKQEFEKGQDALRAATLDAQSVKSNYETIILNIDSINISIKSIRDSIENTIIRAPITGVLDEKNVTVGQYITVQGSVTNIAKVKNISSVDAVIQIQQEDLQFVKLGQKANVSLGDDNNKVFEGHVKSIDVSANPQARTFNCKIEINNNDNILRPGIFMKVEISKDEKKQIIAIPVRALAGSEGNYLIFVAEDGSANKKTVTIGEIFKDKVEIKSGLRDKEIVITSNLNNLQDGDKVEIIPTQGG
jgi:RND family efflux transporter MFP subunit